MKTIAIEEHFITPMYRQKIAANEFRNFYLSSRSEQIGHDIVEQNSDLGAKRLAHMDSAGIDVQVLSFGSPGPQGFGADVAIPMAKDANDLAHEAVTAHPDRFAAFAALPTADPGAAAEELERCVTRLGFKGAMIHGHARGSFLDEKKYWVIFERAQALGVPLYLHPTLPHPDALKAYFQGYELPFPAHRLRRGVRRLPAPEDHPRASGRRIAFRDAPAERSHLAGGRAKGPGENAAAVSEGQSARHHQRQLVRARVPVHAARARRRQHPVRRGLALRAEHRGNGIPEKTLDQRRRPREDLARQRRAHPADVMHM